ncbi:TPA: oxidoreductase [Candidatus Marinimicrobia bacterium]|nr:MAG: FAD-dependent pyridine nucleotide-disulfide oxidoreductase [Marinimicrobia bacterium 46_47]KUK90199.1 MAG: pyridine nucleotide-disulfide oxidoreductase domain protein [Marinimicrobia bacterium 46_43]HAE87774.1 oxidoreductase [Candidatus Neomarinimicrobiota bacterium]HBY18321.1 oxidoreductase [Candidatus Neomarinimicrobiota bacterium]
MKKLLILGAGTAGTMMANKLVKQLDKGEWKITLVDKVEEHYYQPGLLFIPFNIYKRNDVVKPKRDFIPSDVELIMSDIEVIEPEQNRVKLKNGQVLSYDFLIIATGTQINPDETEGLKGDGWYKNIFDFYTLEGACNLQKFLKFWQGGKLVLNITEMPIKCPVAPLEFLFLADWWFTEKGIRDQVDLTFVTPLPGAFTKPRAAQVLGDFLQKKNINLVPEFSTGSVDSKANKIRSWDGKEVDYDLLVTIPTNMGDPVIERSGMGDELNFVPTHPKTLQSKEWENVFVIGDATNLPSSKAGAVAHFQAEILQENLLRAIDGLPLKEDFDGHANCFIESGFGKGMLIDFNYDVEPLPGKYPLPGIGPFSLLEETKMNHWGKMMFRWVYWNILIKGGEMPIEAQMNMAGKIR